MSLIDSSTLSSALYNNLKDATEEVVESVIDRYNKLYHNDEFVISQKGLFNACLNTYVEKLHRIVKRTIEECHSLKSGNVLKTRLTENDLKEPKEYYVQYGEIFGNRIEWVTEPIKTTLTWTEDNGFCSPGIDLNDGGHGYAGWDGKRSLYLRHDDDFEANEHCFRIVLKNE